MTNCGSSFERIGRTPGRRRAALKQSEKSRRTNRKILDAIVNSHGHSWLMRAEKRCESVLVMDGDGPELTRMRLRYWQSCGWITLKHCGGNAYRIEVVE
jgi:hypothetical protein